MVSSLWIKRETDDTADSLPDTKVSYLPLPSLCAKALGSCSPLTVAINAAWALLYMASFLLDKVEDQEMDHPLVSHFGIGPLANLTTGLILHAERILADLEPGYDLDEARLRAIRVAFNQHALSACAGQHLDLTASRQSLNGAWEVISGKSGAFFALGGCLGALAAGASPDQVEQFSQFGYHLGILVQIANDIGGLLGSNGASDLAQGKKTLPVIYALQALPGDQSERLAGLLAAAPADPAAEFEAKKIIISAGALVYLSLEADKHRQSAKRIIRQLGLPSEGTGPLTGLLDHAINTSDYYRKFDQAPL